MAFIINVCFQLFFSFFFIFSKSELSKGYSDCISESVGLYYSPSRFTGSQKCTKVE